MKKSVFMLVLLTMTLVTLTGCLYPQDELAKNKIPNEEQLEMVQTAVLQYMDETDGLLPIKTKDNDVDDYEKYLIDFNMLKERQLISEPPGTAYENGGVYQYGVVTPEEDPRVKLIDLRITEAIRSVNIKLNTYRNKHTYPPYGEEVADGLYEVNYDKLGMKKAPEIISPYSQNPLRLIMNTDGDLYVDYSSDLQQAIDEYDHNFKEGDDIRSILVDHYPFMPAYSLPYTIKDSEVEFLETSN
ncbi:MAG TPA: hypothetical protein VK073_03255 [Pseudogracilibacillus sp.]|nr:hypothetical protein [Pseudogracilibacillus sp.]